MEKPSQTGCFEFFHSVMSKCEINRPTDLGETRWHDYNMLPPSAKNKVVHLFSRRNKMSKRIFAVVGCRKTKVSLHGLPKDENRKIEWFEFLFSTAPPNFSRNSMICSTHFTLDCFINREQHGYKEATYLIWPFQLCWCTWTPVTVQPKLHKL